MRAALTLSLLGLCASARLAAAFPTGSQFDLDPLTSDGAGGIAFDGAPRWSEHTCAVCHIDTPGRIGLKLEADKPELFTDGWKANQQYHLRVVLSDEWAGLQYQKAGDNCGFRVMPYVPCDENGFALELDDGAGRPVGKLGAVVNGACATGMPPPDVDVYVLKDGSAVVHNGAHHGLTQWDLCWTAPAAGAGTITAYLAAVDGNGGNGTMDFPQDATGDDVASGTVPIAESGGKLDTQTGGCASVEPGGGVVLLLVVGWLLVRKKKLAVWLAIATLAGCVHVRPRQRETLAKRNMKFSPDPVEDELDLHMQEAREGSSGGYGSSGGGCGCN